MTIADAPLTSGIIAGTIIAAVILIASLAALAWSIVWYRDTRGNYDRSEARFAIGISALVVVATIGLYIGASWPFSYEYHHWMPAEGTVARVSSRIVTNDGDIKQKFVVTFTDGRVRAIDDTAAATLREGDLVKLRCKRAYDFGVPRSSHGWDCKWAGARS